MSCTVVTLNKNVIRMLLKEKLGIGLSPDIHHQSIDLTKIQKLYRTAHMFLCIFCKIAVVILMSEVCM